MYNIIHVHTYTSLSFFMSSASSFNSTDFRFSSILVGVTDLAITTSPRCRANDMHTFTEGGREGGRGVREGGRKGGESEKTKGREGGREGRRQGEGGSEKETEGGEGEGRREGEREIGGSEGGKETRGGREWD